MGERRWRRRGLRPRVTGARVTEQANGVRNWARPRQNNITLGSKHVVKTKSKGPTQICVGSAGGSWEFQLSRLPADAGTSDVGNLKTT